MVAVVNKSVGLAFLFDGQEGLVATLRSESLKARDWGRLGWVLSAPGVCLYPSAVFFSDRAVDSATAMLELDRFLHPLVVEEEEECHAAG